MHRFARAVAFALMISLFGITLAGTLAVSSASAQDTPTQTIAEIAAATPDLSTLVTALSAAADAGGTDLLTPAADPSASLTVFAPTNAAFTALGSTLDDALADPTGLLSTVLTNHVVGSEKAAATLIVERSATALSGNVLDITLRNGSYYVGSAKLVTTDIRATNGIVHVIDAVLVPAIDAGTPNQHGTFAAPVVATSAAPGADRTDQTGAFTAPNASTATAPAAAPASAEPMALANTGSESLPLFVVAALLMMIGAVVLLAADRRELALVNARIRKPAPVQAYAWPEVPSLPDHSAFSDEVAKHQG